MDLNGIIAIAVGGLVMIGLRLGNLLVKWVAKKLGVEEKSDDSSDALQVAATFKK